MLQNLWCTIYNQCVFYSVVFRRLVIETVIVFGLQI